MLSVFAIDSVSMWLLFVFVYSLLSGILCWLSVCSRLSLVLGLSKIGSGRDVRLVNSVLVLSKPVCTGLLLLLFVCDNVIVEFDRGELDCPLIVVLWGLGRRVCHFFTSASE